MKRARGKDSRLSTHVIPERGAVSDTRGESDRCSCGVALEGRLGQAYNEEAFRYFLALERKRCEGSGRPFLLLLVDLKEPPGAAARIDRTVASKLFSGLWLCLRETDIVGWYREDHVAGAVLTGLDDGPRRDVARLVGQRVSEALGKRLPSEVARQLQVRVSQHPEPERSDVGGRFYSVVQPDGPSWWAELNLGEI